MTRASQSRVGAAHPFAELEALLGHRFARPELLRLALTHRSFAYEERGIDERVVAHKAALENGVDNEQLEFVGDAVLGLVAAEAVFRRFPQASEGQLTQMRAALVSRKRMAEMGAALRLGEFLIFGRSAERVGGRTRPTLLANAAEAVIAAVYLDGGLAPVQALLERVLVEPDAAGLAEALLAGPTGALRDPKTMLQERVQAGGAGKLRYVDAGQSGPAHQRLFMVDAVLESSAGNRTLASGKGSSKKEAQQRAAEQALAAWPTAESGAGA